MPRCEMVWMPAGETDWSRCTREDGHPGHHHDAQGRYFFPPPYPFCRHPNKCVNGRCESEIACND